MGFKSFLSKVGHDIEVGFQEFEKVEKVAEPIVEGLIPVSAPVFALIDAGMGIITDVEGAFTAAGQQANGAAKLEAAIPGMQAALAAWVQANFPGSKLVPSQATVTQWVNAFVAILNEVDPNAKPVSSAMVPTITASAIVHSLIKASNPTTPKV
jgi:hypothetical protein